MILLILIWSAEEAETKRQDKTTPRRQSLYKNSRVIITGLEHDGNVMKIQGRRREEGRVNTKAAKLPFQNTKATDM